MFGITGIKFMAIGLVVLAIVGSIIGVKMHIEKLDAQIITLTAQNATLEAANQQDAANIQASNDAVTALQNATKNQSRAAANALAAAQKSAVVKEQQINDLLMQRPTGNLSQDCALLDQNLNSLIGGK